MPTVRRSPAFLAFDQELKNYSLAKFDFDFDTEGADVCFTLNAIMLKEIGDKRI